MEADLTYWASMDDEDRLPLVLADSSAAQFAYRRLKMHRYAAQTQMRRIQDAIVASNTNKPAEPLPGASQVELREYMHRNVARMQRVLSEVHLYFVSWTGCRNMLQLIVGQPELLEAKRVFDARRKEFEHYVAGRNSFEHFHERLPGQKDEKRVAPVDTSNNHRIYSGFKSGKYIHSTMEWDISPASLGRLEDHINAVLAAVHTRINDLKPGRLP